MPILSNPKHELFAQELAKGMTQADAYLAAGYKGDRTAASRLSTNVNIVDRVAEILAAGAERAEITEEMVIRELAKIGFSDMRRLLKWSGNRPQFDEDEAEASGDVSISVANFVQLFDSDDLDDDTAACISEISQTKEGALKVKLYDKQTALVNIGKHLGMFKERVELTGKNGAPIETVDRTPREIAKDIAFTLAKGAKQQTVTH